MALNHTPPYPASVSERVELYEVPAKLPCGADTQHICPSESGTQSLHTASKLSGLGEIVLCFPMPQPLIYTMSTNIIYLKGLWWGFNASKVVKDSSQLGIR